MSLIAAWMTFVIYGLKNNEFRITIRTIPRAIARGTELHDHRFHGLTMSFKFVAPVVILFSEI